MKKLIIIVFISLAYGSHAADDEAQKMLAGSKVFISKRGDVTGYKVQACTSGTTKCTPVISIDGKVAGSFSIKKAPSYDTNVIFRDEVIATLEQVQPGSIIFIGNGMASYVKYPERERREQKLEIPQKDEDNIIVKRSLLERMLEDIKALTGLLQETN